MDTGKMTVEQFSSKVLSEGVGYAAGQYWGPEVVERVEDLPMEIAEAWVRACRDLETITHFVEQHGEYI